MKTQQKDESTTPKNIFQINSIQEVLSIGYILLVVGGMIIEYFGLIPHGVNIFSYSDILDFLIVPFKTMIVAPCILIIFVINRFFQYKEKRQKQDIAAGVIIPEEKLLKKNHQAQLLFTAIMFLSMTAGFSLGEYFGAERAKEKVASGEKNRVIEFIAGGSKEVYLIGNNNNNLFYYENEESEITICPIAGNVKQIKKLKKKEEKKEQQNKSEIQQTTTPSDSQN